MFVWGPLPGSHTNDHETGSTSRVTGWNWVDSVNWQHQLRQDGVMMVAKEASCGGPSACAKATRSTVLQVTTYTFFCQCVRSTLLVNHTPISQPREPSTCLLLFILKDSDSIPSFTTQETSSGQILAGHVRGTAHWHAARLNLTRRLSAVHLAAAGDRRILRDPDMSPVWRIESN